MAIDQKEIEEAAQSDLVIKALMLWNQGAVNPATVQSLDERKAAMGLPVHILMDELAALGEVIYLAATYVEKVTNPGFDPGEPIDDENQPFSDGWYVTVGDPADLKVYGAFVGGMVLKRDIAGIVAANAFPFHAALTRKGTGRGHPWMFTSTPTNG